MRHEAGFSQRHAAAGLGVSQALLSHYENDAREPKLDFVLKACQYYGVSADYILGRADTKERNHYLTADSCERAPQFIETACAVFDTLNKLSDRELYSAALDYLTVSMEIISTYLKEPDTQYDPIRDAEQKIAEAAFIARVRGAKP